MKPGDKVIIHYAASNATPDECWRDRPGTVLVVARGKPCNVLVETDIGLVVVPKGNVRILAL
jgi:hypothetical protein